MPNNDRKRLDLSTNKKPATPKKPLVEETEVILEEEPKQEVFRYEAPSYASNDDKVAKARRSLTEEKETKSESKPRPKLSLGKSKKKQAKPEVKPDFLDMDGDGNTTEPMKKAVDEAKPKAPVKEEVLETYQDRMLGMIDHQLSAMSKSNRKPEAGPVKSITEQKIDNMEGQLRDMRRMVLEMSGMASQNTIVGGLGAGSPGSGEVRLLRLDDVDANNIANGETLVWDSSTGTFVNGAGGGGLTQQDVDNSIQAAADTIVPAATANSQGYFFQNSHYFSGGLTHIGNPDVAIEVESGVETIVKFSDTDPREFGGFLQADLQSDPSTPNDISHMYDRSTGVISLKGLEAAQFILIRVSIDLEPDSDNSSADIILRCTANNTSGGFTFDIQEQLASLDQGADIEYPTQVSIPIFIGDTLSEDSSVSTITPIVKFSNTDGDIKPRSLAIFIWS